MQLGPVVHGCQQVPVLALELNVEQQRNNPRVIPPQMQPKAIVRWADADALLVINGSISPRDVRLPADRGESYTLAWDSAWKKPRTTLPVYAAGAMTNLEALSIRLYLSSRVS